MSKCVKIYWMYRPSSIRELIDHFISTGTTAEECGSRFWGTTITAEKPVQMTCRSEQKSVWPDQGPTCVCWRLSGPSGRWIPNNRDPNWPGTPTPRRAGKKRSPSSQPVLVWSEQKSFSSKVVKKKNETKTKQKEKNLGCQRCVVAEWRWKSVRVRRDEERPVQRISAREDWSQERRERSDPSREREKERKVSCQEQSSPPRVTL